MTSRRSFLALSMILSISAWAAAVWPAQAGLSRAEIASVGFDDRGGRTLPSDALTEDASGQTLPLTRRLAGEPALVAFVDYTCETVCGVAANALAAAEQSLAARSDLPHRVLVLGFDARDDAEDRAAWLRSNPEAASLGETNFLLADTETTRRIVESAGLRTVYDADHDQFAHPAGALLVGSDGRIVRALDLVSLVPDTLRLALVEASGGTGGTFVERAILSCYGWDAETGRYAPLISITLMVAGGATVAAVLALVGLFLLRESRTRTGEDEASPEGGATGNPAPKDEEGHRLA